MAINPAAILVRIPNKITIPAINSKSPMINANSGGSPIFVNEFPVPAISSNLGNPCIISPIPAIILNDKGPKSEILVVC